MESDDTISPRPGPRQLCDLVGVTLAGRYRIDSLLGEGGMGAVFKGRHLKLHRDLAIKVLRPELTAHPEAAPRFEREAMAASRLEHPNIVQVFDFGAQPCGGHIGEIKYIVMQMLQGRELADLLGRPLPPPRALELTAQILRGLAHAHGRGIVHRDLKPENVFVTLDHGGAEVLKLVDFGIAKLLDAGGDVKKLTQMGAVFGTPAYMSPEQALGETVDHRTDLYAMGIILYEMLGGVPPFDADDLVSLLRMQVLGEPAPLPGLPAAVSGVLDGLLAKKKAERFQTAEAALQAVEGALFELGQPHTGAASGGFPPPAHASPPPPQAGGGRPSFEADALAQTGLPGFAPQTTAPAGPANGSATVSMPAFPGGTALPQVTSVSLPAMARSGGAPAPRRGTRWLAGAVGLFGLVAGLAAWAGASGASGADDPAAPSTAPVGLPEALLALAEATLPVQQAPESVMVTARSHLAQGKPDEALGQLDALVEQYPRDPRLHWLRGEARSRIGGREDEALESYRRALALDPALPRDRDVYARLAVLLRRPAFGPALGELAVAGEPAVVEPLLVEAVNRTKDALAYPVRHRLLDAITSVEGNRAVNHALNVALDLWQAPQAERPCAAYEQALDEIDEAPRPEYWRSVDRAPLPRRGEAEEEGACEGLAEHRREVLARLKRAFPRPPRWVPEDYKHKAGGRRGNPFARIFR